MRQPNRTMRRSHTISPFGVGAICNLGKESFVIMDIEKWGPFGRRIEHIPLQRTLQVSGFREAEDLRYTSRKLPVFRFPRWLFCNRCRRMVFLSRGAEDGSEPTCPDCKGRRILVPMRFVLVCSNGHLDDVPWKRWAHSRTNDLRQRQCQVDDLEFLSDARSAGLDSLSVRCRVCSATRTLAGINSADAMQTIGVRCWGTQPWEWSNDPTACDQVPRVIQRGAGDLYFAHVTTGLDIPPFSDFDVHSESAVRIRAHQLFPFVSSNPKGDLADQLISTIARVCNTDDNEVRTLVDREARLYSGQAPELVPHNLEEEEYRAFLTPNFKPHPRNRFITEHVSLTSRTGSLDEAFTSHIDTLVIGTKLRLVRALSGFSRYEQNRTIPADLGRGQDWLPAIEVFGEGIFLRLNEQRLCNWETQPFVQSRVAPLAGRKAQSFLGRHLAKPSARFVLLHTLSHLLIRQLAYECGYTSACLSERLYVSEATDDNRGMAGLLIYTADGDSEGTLGGLARQGRLDRLMPTLLAALQGAQWCSLDPVCGERSSQGFDGLNLAACHACALVSETSCGYFNCLLDRSLVIGEHGFFSPLLTTVEDMLES